MKKKGSLKAIHLEVDPETDFVWEEVSYCTVYCE